MRRREKWEKGFVSTRTIVTTEGGGGGAVNERHQKLRSPLRKEKTKLTY